MLALSLAMATDAQVRAALERARAAGDSRVLDACRRELACRPSFELFASICKPERN